MPGGVLTRQERDGWLGLWGAFVPAEAREALVVQPLSSHVASPEGTPEMFRADGPADGIPESQPANGEQGDPQCASDEGSVPMSV